MFAVWPTFTAVLQPWLNLHWEKSRHDRCKPQPRNACVVTETYRVKNNVDVCFLGGISVEVFDFVSLRFENLLFIYLFLQVFCFQLLVFLEPEGGCDLFLFINVLLNSEIEWVVYCHLKGSSFTYYISWRLQTQRTVQRCKLQEVNCRAVLPVGLYLVIVHWSK